MKKDKVTTENKIVFLFILGVIIILLSHLVIGVDYSLINVTMLGNQSPAPYNASCSKQNGVNNACYEAYDDILTGGSGGWQPSGDSTGWNKWYLGSGNYSKITQYEVCVYNSASYRPTAWSIQISNVSNGANYTIDNRSAQDITPNTCRNYTINNGSENYIGNYLTMTITASSGGGALLVQEINYYQNTTVGGVTTPPFTNYILTPCNNTYTYGSGENINISYSSAGSNNITYTIYYSSVDNITSNNIIDTINTSYIWDYNNWGENGENLDNGSYYISTIQYNQYGSNESFYNISCKFNICKNAYQQVRQPCIDGYKHIYYTDINNCSIPYFLPADNDTYITCSVTPTQAENNQTKALNNISNGLYAIALGLIILGGIYIKSKNDGGSQ